MPRIRSKSKRQALRCESWLCLQSSLRTSEHEACAELHLTRSAEACRRRCEQRLPCRRDRLRGGPVGADRVGAEVQVPGAGHVEGFCDQLDFMPGAEMKGLQQPEIEIEER